MGKNKKGFNRKAREQSEIVIDNSSLSQIKVVLPSLKGKYDESNPLVLPSKKRTTKKKKNTTGPTRILSKKQKKKLEKIVEKKKKKLDRSEILEALAKVQAPLEELNQLTSISSIQTKGLKRHFADIEHNKSNDFIYPENKDEIEAITLNSISGSKRRKRILSAVLRKNKEENLINDPSIVGFEDSASSNEEESDVEEHNTEEIDIKSEDGEEEKEDSNIDINDKNVMEEEVLESSKNKITEHDSNNADVEIITEKIIDKMVTLKKEKDDIANVNVSHKSAVFVPVYRSPEIQAARLELPILGEEQTVMEVINENDVVIIAGETGSGKTTQVPQFLFEAGHASGDKIIGITQPRRVAAIAMSKRVAEEMNLGTDVVSFLIRFEGNVTSNTKIKFMTDGVLLKEIQTDFTLSKYSVIILDEAHERNVYTDILIGLLSRIAPLRKKKNDPLKLIIMSATLRVEDFTQNTRLFKNPPPVVQVETRQYPVSVHFNKRTPADYLKECFHKAVKIHTKLPEGGILIFVTGQQEVNILVRKLRSSFPFTKQEKEGSDVESDLKESLENVKKNKKNRIVKKLPKIDLDKYSVVPTDDTEGDLIEDEDLDDICDDETMKADEVLKECHQPLWVLPLYSLLPSSKQAKVFEKPPPNCRLIVVSTNVAETSLTIPNIKYVIDSGKTKTKLYDKVTGVSAYHVTWCSKASANQRAGRAGRIGPGHCYRLYSSAVFNDEFDLFSIPEIQQKPVDDLVLQMKAMNIVKVVNFPFPTSPDILQLKTAEKRLKILGALQSVTDQDEWSGRLTKLGETMASFPVSPRYAKMLALSYQFDLLQYTICIVAALSVQEVLLQNEGDDKWNRLRRIWAGTGNSLFLGDIMVLLRAVGAAECSKNNLEEFCEKNGLRHKAIVEIRKLRVQLTNQINLNIPDLNLIVNPNMKPPTDTQAKLLRQIVLSGMGDQVAHKVNPEEIANKEDKLKWKRAYRHCEMEEPIFMHSGSVLKKEMPEWVVYQEVYETNKLYMRGVTAIEPEWLPIFVSELCNLSEPLTDPPPKYDSETGKIHCSIEGTFGKAAFPLPVVNIPYTTTLDSYKWFAMFLLNGEIFPKLKKFTASLLSPPLVLKKSWAKLQPRTEILLKALVSKEINTKDSLLEAWKEDQYYLLSAYKTWLPESAHESLTAIWPPT